MTYFIYNIRTSFSKPYRIYIDSMHYVCVPRTLGTLFSHNITSFMLFSVASYHWFMSSLGCISLLIVNLSEPMSMGNPSLRQLPAFFSLSFLRVQLKRSPFRGFLIVLFYLWFYGYIGFYISPFASFCLLIYISIFLLINLHSLCCCSFLDVFFIVSWNMLVNSLYIGHISFFHSAKTFETFTYTSFEMLANYIKKILKKIKKCSDKIVETS